MLQRHMRNEQGKGDAYVPVKGVQGGHPVVRSLARCFFVCCWRLSLLYICDRYGLYHGLALYFFIFVEAQTPSRSP